MLTDWLEIEDGEIRNVNFSGVITINNGFNINVIQEKINEVLKNFMSVEIRDMGEPLRISDVYAILDNIEGISFVELSNPIETIVPENNELLVLGNIDFNFIVKENSA